MSLNINGFAKAGVGKPVVSYHHRKHLLRLTYMMDLPSAMAHWSTTWHSGFMVLKINGYSGL